MLKGVLAVILASITYGIMPVFSKLALETGMNAQSIVFYRFLLSFLCSGILLCLTGVSGRAERKQLRDMVFFGICGFGLTILLLTLSYQSTPTGTATMLHFSYPLFVALLMTAVFGEQMNRQKLTACLCAMAGLLFMADFSGSHAAFGLLTALISGVTYAIFVIAGKKASFHTLPPLTVVFYCSMSAAAVFGMHTMWNGTLQFPPNPQAWAYLWIISLVCTVFPLCMMTIGIRSLGASTASILNMAEPVTSIAAGALCFGESLNASMFAGSILIILSGILFVRSTQNIDSR